ncbi:MAG: hypothetical protein LBG79_01495 [Spirochaetaceae bacterium]|jgi:hypothetical protein|nr:hypothetical protein [Spirochaetaceae bacterium]GMO22696.1 MAG: hypothetical protein Pg6A_09930 [Termitinemataceae bacterium]
MRVGFCFILSLFLFLSCSSGIFEKHDHKDLIISDTDPNYQVQIKDIEGKYIIVVLIEGTPNLNSLTADDIINSPYSIGRVKTGIINVRLSKILDYWDGSGSYWIAFLLPTDNGRKVTLGYLSKGMTFFDQSITFVSNDDFDPPLPLNIDIGNMLNL